MNIHLIDQKNILSRKMTKFKEIPLMSFDPVICNKKVTSCVIKSLIWEAINFDFFFDYQLFPSNIMCAHGEWFEKNRSMQLGDTIIQQIYLPPFNLFSLKLIAGVRIISIINESKKKEFTYQTLRGHVESGISTFTFAKQENGEVLFSINTISRPSNNLNNKIGFLFALPYQRYCTNQVLKNVNKQLEIQILKSEINQ